MYKTDKILVNSMRVQQLNSERKMHLMFYNLDIDE